MDAENQSNSPRRRLSDGKKAARKIRSPGRGDDQAPLGDVIRAEFRSRIGEDRHDVWFGDNLGIVVKPGSDGGPVVTVLAGTSFTHDWLQRTFRDDFAAAVERVLGRSGGLVQVVWGPFEAAPSAGDNVDPVVDAPAVGGDMGIGREVPGRRRASTARSGSQRPGRGSLPGGEPAPLDAGIGNRMDRGGAGAAAPRAAGQSGGAPIPSAEAGQGSGRPASPARALLTLEQYVVGVGNRMAHAAAALAAEQPGAMSPLVLHGPGGVGKTHLLEGICRRTRERFPRAAMVMLSAEQFTTTFLESLHGRRGLPGFRRSLRAADLLVIDDIQFLIGKKATISELLHTLETLHRAGKQVVFGSDRDVESLAELGADLQARLRGGMCARVLPPDEATRTGIVDSLAARRGLQVPPDVVAFVAARMTRNTRELAGAVNRLEATSHMLGIPVTLDMAEECLAELVRSSTRAVRIADIERAVCTALGVDPGSLQSSCRVRRVNHPRMLAMFLARKHTPAALAEIGAYFGRRSHSTVISAQRTVDGWIASGSRLTLADAEWGIEEAIRRVEENLRVG